jgi:hypothetical protein
MLEYAAQFMELLRYALHLNKNKLKVNTFVYGLNPCIKEKVHILIPKTLHELVQRDSIAEEELHGKVEEKISRSLSNLLFLIFMTNPLRVNFMEVVPSLNFPSTMKP